MAKVKKTEEIIDVPEMAEYDPPSSLDSTKTSTQLTNIRTHRSPNWDGVTGIIIQRVLH